MPSIPLAHLRTTLDMCRMGMRSAAYTTHPYTGSDCRHPHGWRAHGGAMVSPWAPGMLLSAAERVLRGRGRNEVRRSFGCGYRELMGQLRPVLA